jgi:hypothetical protein
MNIKVSFTPNDKLIWKHKLLSINLPVLLVYLITYSLTSDRIIPFGTTLVTSGIIFGLMFGLDNIYVSKIDRVIGVLKKMLIGILASIVTTVIFAGFYIMIGQQHFYFFLAFGITCFSFLGIYNFFKCLKFNDLSYALSGSVQFLLLVIGLYLIHHLRIIFV